MRRAGVLLATLALSACAVGPNYKPATMVPAVEAGFTNTAPVEPAGAMPVRWWSLYADPTLDRLVEEALTHNSDLRVAAANLERAQAILRGERSALLPSTQLSASAQFARNNGTTAGQSDSLFGSSGALSYEVDLFGRMGADVSAARADAAASEATYRSVLLSLQADVAQTYFRIRSLDAELATLARNIDLREQSVRVNQSRFDNGDIGEFDLVRAKSELTTARADALVAQRQRVNLEHALAVLVGRPAAQFAAATDPLVGNVLPVIPGGMPSTLLQRRPDVAAAQRAMVAANARIGEARAAMFPALSLSAQGGGASSALSNMLHWSSRSWVLGALMSLPVIDGGRNRNNITRSEAVLEESVANYRQNVLVAFSEVEDNLAGLRILASQAEQVDAGVVFARRSADLAQKLYDAGRSSYLDLLDAQRNLSLVERNAAQLRGDRAVTTVALIRALGGGWGNDQPLPETIAQK